ncbi:MAG TPA: hypothetical protein VGQ57_01665 [Polyangiaceae bacterium]|nr:hypothetical protein [Polyangiaceae bacterium]
MSARQQMPRSGSPGLADLPRGQTHDLRHRTWDSSEQPELKGKVAQRRSASFAAPLRDSFRESFFDLAQRYHTLRDAARNATSRPKKGLVLAPIAPVARERRLADLPPPPLPDEQSGIIEEPPEEPTLVQPLAARSEPPPPESERRPTTMRPPPPPDPLPRMLLPSTLPPPVALPTSLPPPPAPPQSVWRPMLAAAALSATIGALVSGGFLLLRSGGTPPQDAVAAASIAPANTQATGTMAPCPIGASPNGTSLGGGSRSSGSIASTSLGTSTSTLSSTSSSLSSTNRSSSPAPLQVSVDNLPLETRSGRLIESGTVSSPAPAPRLAAVHVAPVVAPAPAVAARPSAAERAAERKRARQEAQAAREAQKAASASTSDEESAVEKAVAAPEPPPAPTKGPDRAAIAKAVARASGAATACDSGPRAGRAAITFAPSGNVQSVQLVESFGDNSVNGCVLRALGRAHVPAFTGGPVEVRKALSW